MFFDLYNDELEMIGRFEKVVGLSGELHTFEDDIDYFLRFEKGTVCEGFSELQNLMDFPAEVRVLDSSLNTVGKYHIFWKKCVFHTPAKNQNYFEEVTALCELYDFSHLESMYIWELWSSSSPSLNQWAGLDFHKQRAWLEVAFREAWYRGPFVQSKRRSFTLDGSHVTNETNFYIALGEAIIGPRGFFGWNLDSLEECLSTGYFGTSAPFELVWKKSQVFMDSHCPAVQDRAFLASLIETKTKFPSTQFCHNLQNQSNWLEDCMDLLSYKMVDVIFE